MIIEKTHIEKFRGFDDVGFPLGNQITIISGKNGTQKTTVLGLLSQPFSISEKDHPMKDEKPLTGGNFRSQFGEKFRLSESYDVAKSHKWTLYLKGVAKPFILESINHTKGIRFWRQGDRSAGSGYVKLPVIYLSLKRLIPIGEDAALEANAAIKLTSQEQAFYKKWHNKILISQETLKSADYLESSNKNTLGVNTDKYDWKQNSAGQDNIGKILLAIMSFQRLKAKYPHQYQGGILAIDEMDASLYPGSQILLLKALRRFSSDLKLQIFLTTHSISLLEAGCALQSEANAKPASQGDVEVLFFEKYNDRIKVIPQATISTIRHRLNVTIGLEKEKKIIAFTEDKEARYLVKSFLKTKHFKLSFVDCALSSSNLLSLALADVPSFVFPNAMIFIDGDVKTNATVMGKQIKRLKNVVMLPTECNPERMIAEHLFKLDDHDRFWQSINPDFTKSYCFKEFSLEEISSDRVKAKQWFQSHLKIWGNNASKVFNHWMKAHPDEVKKFVDDFTKVYNSFAKEFALPSL